MGERLECAADRSAAAASPELAIASCIGTAPRKCGLLVHVTSIGGRLTIPFYGLYCVSKIRA